MEKAEILEIEIKKKIRFIENHFLKSHNVETEIEKKLPKYLDSISTLEKENNKLKVELEELNKRHKEDLKQLEDLMIELSNLVEPNNA